MNLRRENIRSWLSRAAARLSCFGLLAATIPVAFAEAEGLEEALAEISNNTEEIKTWASDYVMLMTIQGMPTTTDGRMEVRGNLMRNEMSMNVMGQAMSMLTVLDPEGMTWVETHALGQRIVMKMDMRELAGAGGAAAGLGAMNPLQGETSVDPGQLVRMLSEQPDVVYVGRQEVEGVEVLGFEMPFGDELGQMFDPMGQWEEAGLTPERLQILISPADGFPRLWQVVDPAGKALVSMIYKDVQINPELPDGRFAYTPPEGAQVMDMTAMAGGLLQGQGRTGMLEGGDAAVAPPVEAQEPVESRYNLKFKDGDTAPEFSGADPRGGTVRLSDHRGKIVVLDFWATWSEPYLKEMPGRVALQGGLRGRGATLIGVSLDTDKQAVLDLLGRQEGINWPQVFDGKGWNGAVAQAYGIEAIPHTIVIDRGGTIRHTGLRGEALRQAVEALLAE
jgi:outer membrane lipoprotein-sorting protein/peroxiredoxin